MENHSHPFENIGYHIDYTLDGKYMGSIKLEKPDRDVMGYGGRQYHIADQRIKFKKKYIPFGAKYHTECYPLCGRVIADDHLTKMEIIAQNFAGIVNNKIGE